MNKTDYFPSEEDVHGSEVVSAKRASNAAWFIGPLATLQFCVHNQILILPFGHEPNIPLSQLVVNHFLKIFAHSFG